MGQSTPQEAALGTKVEGPTPTILARSKPANSLQPRQSVAGSLHDGPYGGKKPQS